MNATVATPQTIKDKKYGELVVLEENDIFVKVHRAGDGDWTAFWYPKSKLVHVEPKVRKSASPFPSVNRRPLDNNDEPWRAYVRATGTVRAHALPDKIKLFLARLEQANGQQLDTTAKGIIVDAENCNHWGVSLQLNFPAPLPEDFPSVNVSVKGKTIVVTDGPLIWDLLDNGMHVG